MIAGLLAAALLVPGPGGAVARQPGDIVPMPFAEVAGIVEVLREDLVPARLRATGAGAEEAWQRWAAERSAELGERLLRGDEDSIVNLFWFGTSHTSEPRLTPERLAALDRRASDQVFAARLRDLTQGLLAPGANERLAFGRSVAIARGVDVETAGAAERVGGYLEELVQRSLAELAALQGAPPEAQSTLYRERGLSSDTSLPVNFALERALQDAADQDYVTSGSIARVAIVGPGLDFVDKESGWDVYPPQIVQPFAVIDSLRRLRLAGTDLRVTTFDVNPRVSEHIAAAASRAARGEPYVIHAAWERDQTASDEFAAFRQRFGGTIGEPAAAPPEDAGVSVRSVAVAPAVVGLVSPKALNLVLERPALAVTERFDLVIATNILLYYDVFQQSLALANVAAMLRPGGLFLSTDFVYPLPAIPMTIVGDTRVGYGRAATDDIILWYQRD
ncbi:MAG: class I SAM-dependent methyltransferase [Acidimicrobiia bacterium]|nr:class I SAM-dependent methyltransferase [Acidimicrobiia bacterium]